MSSSFFIFILEDMKLLCNWSSRIGQALVVPASGSFKIKHKTLILNDRFANDCRLLKLVTDIVITACIKDIFPHSFIVSDDFDKFNVEEYYTVRHLDLDKSLPEQKPSNFMFKLSKMHAIKYCVLSFCFLLPTDF